MTALSESRDVLAYEMIGDWPHVFGAPLFAGDTRSLLDVIEVLARSGDRHLVVTPNVDQLLVARAQPELRRLFREASILLADGAPLSALARALGGGVPPRHTGADLLPAVARLSRERGLRIAITGGSRGVAEQAAARLEREHPGSIVRAVAFPERGQDDVDAQARVATELWSMEPDVVFVCLGFPKQENWVLDQGDRLPPAVYVGAGAAVDFAAGAQVRAPRVIQTLGLEWMWRLVREPRRLAHRYLVRGPGFVRVAWEARRAQRGHRAPASGEPTR